MQFEESESQASIDDKIMAHLQHARPPMNLVCPPAPPASPCCPAPTAVPEAATPPSLAACSRLEASAQAIRALGLCATCAS